MSYLIYGTTVIDQWAFRLEIQDENPNAYTSVRRVIPQLSRTKSDSYFKNVAGFTVSLRFGGVLHEYWVSQYYMAMTAGVWYNLALPSDWDKDEKSIRFTATKNGSQQWIACTINTGVSPATLSVPDQEWQIENMYVPPPAPGDFTLSTNFNISYAELSWTTSANATGYDVRRLKCPPNTESWGAWEVLGSSTGNYAVDWSIVNDPPGTRYYYQIYAYNSTGYAWSNWSGEFQSPGGVWIEGKYATPYVKVNNSWVQTKDVYVKNSSGVWTPTKY